RKLPLEGGEGVVQRIHEQPPHQVQHHDPAAARRLIDADPAARRSRRIVLRPEQPRIAVDEADSLALVPHVVAGGDDIDAGGVELRADFLGDAEAGSRVLAVDDDEIEGELAAQPRQMLEHHLAAGPPHQITTEQHPHASGLSFVAARCRYATLITARSVTSQSSRWSVGSRGTAATSWQA